MKYLRPIPESDKPFYVVSHADWCKYAPWTVVRRRDRRVMVQGNVVQMLQWVQVWGPMHP